MKSFAINDIPKKISKSKIVVKVAKLKPFNIVLQNIQRLSDKESIVKLVLEKYNINLFCITEQFAVTFLSQLKMVSFLNLVKTWSSLSSELQSYPVLSSTNILYCACTGPSGDFGKFENRMEDALSKLGNNNKSVVECLHTLIY